MTPITAAQVMDGVTNSPEVAVMALTRTMNLLREFIVSESQYADNAVHEILVGLYQRSNTIQSALARIATEKHEGHYKTLAFQASVLSAPGQMYARHALGLPEEDEPSTS